MIKYKKYKNNNEHSHAFGKWYARAVHELMEREMKTELPKPIFLMNNQ